ncbi:hypothetical protein FOA52_001576 [Chlamydomonas sp. UWO 241]|nr:hypothetical protein FOA52_001576 [Chlamydomonas sp. UWO 241]
MHRPSRLLETRLRSGEGPTGSDDDREHTEVPPREEELQLEHAALSETLVLYEPAVGGIGVEPRRGGVLRVLFTVASDAVADTVVRSRRNLRDVDPSAAVFDVLSDREEAQHRALWPAFLAAKAAGKRAQFHRARLVVDGERAASTTARLQLTAELEAAFETDGGGQARGQGVDPPSDEAMLAFWTEQGLPDDAAHALLVELVSRGACHTTNQLSSKIQRLQRVLPDVDIAAMASKDAGVLDADISAALLNVICLVEAFPGTDVVSLLVRQPRI